MDANRGVPANACLAGRISAPAPLRLNANLSLRELRQPALVADLARTLAETGLAPDDLTLEITESMAISDPEGTIDVLRRLKALGVRLAVDDFGTGYASLTVLKRFPVDEIKIDRSFVAGLGHNQEDAAIVRATVGVAKALGLGVTAEGVETAEQLVLLGELGCDLGQGYFFAPALAADDLTAGLNTGVFP